VANKDKQNAKSRAWAKANPEAIRTIDRKHKEANKSKRAEAHAEWAFKNKDKRRATSAKRKAARLQATPAWADHSAIALVYAEAMRKQEETGVRQHVDHIVPLQSRLVCGLHVAANLQVIEGADNEGKRNRWWPDMP